MIQISITVEERNGIVSAQSTATDESATTLEKDYLSGIVDSLGRDGNPVHLLAKHLASKYVNTTKGPQ
jgi:hypothetical protein